MPFSATDKPSETLPKENIREMFITVTLLTGSAELAVRSIQGSIQDRSVQKNVTAAIAQAMTAGQGSAKQHEVAPAWLPVELRRVLLLPIELRRCFVLRVLLGLPRSQCATLLQLDDSELNRRVSQAVLALAGLGRKKLPE